MSNAQPIGAREALLSAFGNLARSVRYSSFGVARVIREAKVARSTFYYHFRDKDDLLIENLRPLLRAIAALPARASPGEDIEDWTAHLWEHRAVAAQMLAGATGARFSRALIDELTQGLSAEAADPRGRQLAVLQAHQIAGAVTALLAAWITGRVSASPELIAEQMWSAARGIAAVRDR